jgi:hypothetical protein
LDFPRCVLDGIVAALFVVHDEHIGDKGALEMDKTNSQIKHRGTLQ